MGVFDRFDLLCFVWGPTVSCMFIFVPGLITTIDAHKLVAVAAKVVGVHAAGGAVG